MGLRKKRGESGQSAVEFAALVPIFMILFAIMFQLFGVSFNSQYTHIKSRSKLMNEKVQMEPCGAAAQSHTTTLNQDLTFTGGGGTGSVTIDKTSEIRCN